MYPLSTYPTPAGLSLPFNLLVYGGAALLMGGLAGNTTVPDCDDADLSRNNSSLPVADAAGYLYPARMAKRRRMAAGWFICWGAVLFHLAAGTYDGTPVPCGVVFDFIVTGLAIMVYPVQTCRNHVHAI